MRRLILLSCVAVSFTGLAHPASATLVGQTVNPFFLLGSITGAGGKEDEGTQMVTAAGVHFGEGVSSGSTIDVTGTQIVITNQLPASQPFCSAALPCPDSFTGFDFKFSSGTNIFAVTVNAASAPAFLPSPGGTPPGLTLTSSSEFTVNVAGDAPSPGDELVLDLTFQSVTPPTSIPEPASLAVLFAGVAGLAGVRRSPT